MGTGGPTAEGRETLEPIFLSARSDVCRCEDLRFIALRIIERLFRITVIYFMSKIKFGFHNGIIKTAFTQTIHLSTGRYSRVTYVLYLRFSIVLLFVLQCLHHD